MEKQNIKSSLIFLQKPEFYFGLSLLLFLLMSLLLVLPKYSEFQKLKKDLNNTIIEIEGNPDEGVFVGKKAEVSKKEAQFIELKKNIEQLNKQKSEIIAIVFPEQENVLFLTKLLERYAIDHHSESNPFVLNSISFGKPTPLKPVKPKKGVKPVVPKKAPPVGYMPVLINLPIEASEKNFINFINFIDNSGSILPKDFYRGEIAVPLMTIESLTYSYLKDKENPTKKIVKANFVLNTYIQSSSKNASKSK